jgi:hypothetical protein
MKELGLTAAGLGSMVGFLAAWLWLRASKVAPNAPGDWTYDSPGYEQTIVALLKANESSAQLNGQAARSTAAAVALNAVASLLLALPTP